MVASSSLQGAPPPVGFVGGVVTGGVVVTGDGVVTSPYYQTGEK